MLTLFYFIFAPDRLRAVERLMTQKRFEDVVGRENMQAQRFHLAFYRGSQ